MVVDHHHRERGYRQFPFRPASRPGVQLRRCRPANPSVPQSISRCRTGPRRRPRPAGRPRCPPRRRGCSPRPNRRDPPPARRPWPRARRGRRRCRARWPPPRRQFLGDRGVQQHRFGGQAHRHPVAMRVAAAARPISVSSPPARLGVRGADQTPQRTLLLPRQLGQFALSHRRSRGPDGRPARAPGWRRRAPPWTTAPAPRVDAASRAARSSSVWARRAVCAAMPTPARPRAR